MLKLGTDGTSKTFLPLFPNAWGMHAGMQVQSAEYVY